MKEDHETFAEDCHKMTERIHDLWMMIFERVSDLTQEEQIDTRELYWYQQATEAFSKALRKSSTHLDILNSQLGMVQNKQEADFVDSVEATLESLFSQEDAA